MPPRSLILAIDQGTTSTRTLLFDRDGAVRGRAQRELSQSYPADGWVEHDPEEIWRSTLALARQAMADPGAVAGVGLANQRETTVVWDRATGEAIHPAIVWQDRRTASLCERLRADGLGPMVRDRTGLVLDPYFSATKIAWILDNVAGARGRADRGELAFGTIDSFLIWRLTGGAGHVTDATNASRTLLFDLARQDWDDDLLRLFRVPPSMLPTVVDCAGDFGATPKALFGRSLPIAGVAGDQQAATIGQACVAPGMIKSTYGTGCFALMNTGSEIRTSRHKLLTTLAYRLNGMPTFALEGSIFVAGAAVQWLRDGLKIIGSADETEGLAAAGRSGVVMVPAFVGLGAPYWDADARGAIHGLTRDSGPAELARAALEAVCFQTRDLVDAMAADAGNPVTTLRVDGGMTANRWFLQALADVTGLAIERPRLAETTAYGAALLAGIGTGLIAGLGDLAGDWRADERFEPRMAEAERAQGYDRWRDAVNRTLSRGP